ncbi:MAG TPA: radical SAM protein [Candidatus Nanoarchaeia archaeon]|nr:radical SAM protein [Candidatus Nanoarchaeia archaeon]
MVYFTVLARGISKFANPTDFNRLKAEMLCYGVDVESSKLRELVRSQNPFNEIRSGLGYGWYVRLENGMFVNTSVYFGYNRDSPLKAEFQADEIVLFKDGKPVTALIPLNPPEWYFEKTSSGKEMGRIFQQHGKNALASAIYADCQLFSRSEECKFCRIGDGTDLGNLKIKSIQDLVETAVRAKKYNPKYEVDLNGGTTYTAGTGFEIFIPRVSAIRKALPDTRIAVEAAPPLENRFIDDIVEAGANVLMMNLELWDESMRQKYCPGKANMIPRERYFEALEYAISRLGKGNVSSCLIAGLEDPRSTIEGAKFLVDLEVIPSILPYRPLNPDKIDPSIRILPEDFIAISRDVANYITKAGLKPMGQAGCVGCTGCSLEANLARQPYTTPLIPPP